jgi:hypothetical protein
MPSPCLLTDYFRAILWLAIDLQEAGKTINRSSEHAPSMIELSQPYEARLFVSQVQVKLDI